LGKKEVCKRLFGIFVGKSPEEVSSDLFEPLSLKEAL